jgi:hypothetical protein
VCGCRSIDDMTLDCRSRGRRFDSCRKLSLFLYIYYFVDETDEFLNENALLLSSRLLFLHRTRTSVRHDSCQVYKRSIIVKSLNTHSIRQIRI